MPDPDAATGHSRDEDSLMEPSALPTQVQDDAPVSAMRMLAFNPNNAIFLNSDENATTNQSGAAAKALRFEIAR